MDKRIKISVMGLLSLGVFASIAPLVRLSITVNLSSTVDFLYHAMDVAAWAQAELGMGVIVANLPALRPLLEKILSMRSTIRSDKRSKQKSTDRYLELEEGVRSRNMHSKTSTAKGMETRVYGGQLGDSSSSLEDDHSQKNIVAHQQGAPQQPLHGIQVDRRVDVEISPGQFNAQ